MHTLCINNADMHVVMIVNYVCNHYNYNANERDIFIDYYVLSSYSIYYRNIYCV